MIERTIRSKEEATAWQKQHEAHAPKLDEPAPDFHLFDVKGETSVRLSDFQGERPVALVFGSFT